MVPIRKRQFIRRIFSSGIYTAWLEGGQIQIKNRDIYLTSDLDEIKFLENDPEILPYGVSADEIAYPKDYKLDLDDEPDEYEKSEKNKKPKFIKKEIQYENKKESIIL